MKYTCFFLTLFCSSLFGQSLENETVLLKANNIHTYRIQICHGEGCLNDYYELNREGQEIKFLPAVVAFYTEKTYYPNGKLKAHFIKNHTDGPDSMHHSTHFFYQKDGKIAYEIEKQYEEGIVISQTRTESKDLKKSVLTGPNYQYDAEGRIIGEIIGDLVYPCGYFYEGPHRVVYQYHPSGLIATEEIFGMNGELVVELSYEYETF